LSTSSTRFSSSVSRFPRSSHSSGYLRSSLVSLRTSYAISHTQPRSSNCRTRRSLDILSNQLDAVKGKERIVERGSVCDYLRVLVPSGSSNSEDDGDESRFFLFPPSPSRRRVAFVFRACSRRSYRPVSRLTAFLSPSSLPSCTSLPLLPTFSAPASRPPLAHSFPSFVPQLSEPTDDTPLTPSPSPSSPFPSSPSVSSSPTSSVPPSAATPNPHTRPLQPDGDHQHDIRMYIPSLPPAALSPPPRSASSYCSISALRDDFEPFPFRPAGRTRLSFVSLGIEGGREARPESIGGGVVVRAMKRADVEEVKRLQVRPFLSVPFSRVLTILSRMTVSLYPTRRRSIPFSSPILPPSASSPSPSPHRRPYLAASPPTSPSPCVAPSHLRPPRLRPSYTSSPSPSLLRQENKDWPLTSYTPSPQLSFLHQSSTVSDRRLKCGCTSKQATTRQFGCTSESGWRKRAE
jgi:hypothetical protein